MHFFCRYNANKGIEMKNKIVRQSMAQISFNLYTGAFKEAYKLKSFRWDKSNPHLVIIDYTEQQPTTRSIPITSGLKSLTHSQHQAIK